MVEEERKERAGATADWAASSALSLVPRQRGRSISLERRAKWAGMRTLSLSLSSCLLVPRIVASRRRERGSRARIGRQAWEVGQNQATPRSKSRSDDGGKKAPAVGKSKTRAGRPERGLVGLEYGVSKKPEPRRHAEEVGSSRMLCRRRRCVCCLCSFWRSTARS